ncbi:hypothetical protein HERIO_489 [Hepatospora eriocheir]|uniref:Phosphatidic acid phosphatase type 2/haloperoxidase domain-containing protein n=1 Tax=Hepatospora eriocheir TaxID=1081669 RepID=A0A1X0QD09_9MICR|nr:hypothetical protein HERIO_489 [Hepatospora eriocheir]
MNSLIIFTLISILLATAYILELNIIEITTSDNKKDFKEDTIDFPLLITITFILPLLYYIFIYFNKKKTKECLLLIKGHFLNTINTLCITAFIKGLIKKEGPFKRNKTPDMYYNSSFPSGHSSILISSTLYFIYFNNKRNFKYDKILYFLMILLAILGCSTRILDGKHDIIDVIAGISLGIYVFIINIFLLKYELKKMK